MHTYIHTYIHTYGNSENFDQPAIPISISSRTGTNVCETLFVQVRVCGAGSAKDITWCSSNWRNVLKVFVFFLCHYL